MPKPLTPADCDLRDFPRMMIDIPRLFGSEFDATATDAEWRFGVTLWLKSFHQVPAASLPDDDVQLARLCGLGRDAKTWRKARAVALRGWKLCDDGLLYHDVVAEIALEAWIDKLLQRLSSGAGNAARWKSEFDAAPIEAEIGDAAAMLFAINPKSRSLSKQKVAQSLRRSHRQSPAAVPPGQDTIPPGSQGKGREGNIEPPMVPQGTELFELSGAEPKPPDDPVDTAFLAWNDLARRYGLPVAKDLPDRRRKALAKRIEEVGVEGWREALAAIEVSAFLRGARPGKDGRSFRAHIDFVLQPTSFQRLREGVYGQDIEPLPDHEGREASAPAPSPWLARCREFSRNGYWNTTDWGPKPGKPGCPAPAEYLQQFELPPTPSAEVLPIRRVAG